MSVRAESCHQSIPAQERPAYGDSDRAAGHDGSERSRRLGRREPRLVHSESLPTFSRDGSCHTDLRARELLRAACLGFLFKATPRRRGWFLLYTVVRTVPPRCSWRARPSARAWAEARLRFTPAASAVRYRSAAFASACRLPQRSRWGRRGYGR